MVFIPELLIIIVGTYLIYIFNKKSLTGKPKPELGGKVVIYALEMIAGIAVIKIIMGLINFR